MTERESDTRGKTYAELVLETFEDPAKIQSVLQAVGDYDPLESQAYDKLMLLSSNTQIDAIEAIPEGIFKTGNDFIASATVYVTLSYGSGDDGFESNDSFPATLRGHFQTTDNDYVAKIDEMTVDTTSFYE